MHFFLYLFFLLLWLGLGGIFTVTGFLGGIASFSGYPFVAAFQLLMGGTWILIPVSLGIAMSVKKDSVTHFFLGHLFFYFFCTAMFWGLVFYREW